MIFMPSRSRCYYGREYAAVEGVLRREADNAAKGVLQFEICDTCLLLLIALCVEHILDTLYLRRNVGIDSRSVYGAVVVYAESRGKSLTRFVCEAVESEIGREIKK